MNKIIVTGAGGFIAGALARRLNAEGYNELVLVDDFTSVIKDKNTAGVVCNSKIHRDNFVEWFYENADDVDFVFHMGARTDTTEFNFRVLDSLNLSYSKSVWEICTVKQIPLVYASSAATYGMGEKGFDDAHDIVKNLKPLNPYGLSKQLFDLHVLEQQSAPPFWCGLKFFNVYGFGELHKGRMASVVLHAYRQIKQTGKVKLFASHHTDYRDGEQLRDFIYVDDVTDVCCWLLASYQKGLPAVSGIYNLGTGKARSFNELVTAIFNSLQLPICIEYIPTPEDIRNKYQYFTQAEMSKLRKAGYLKEFTEIEEGVSKYVQKLGLLSEL